MCLHTLPISLFYILNYLLLCLLPHILDYLTNSFQTVEFQ
uniref:Uncharacterized protein n=1 Tax=Anguilla anguilla TaxID=7936 RepID=A0A0E9Q372_ANGAN